MLLCISFCFLALLCTTVSSLLSASLYSPAFQPLSERHFAVLETVCGPQTVCGAACALQTAVRGVQNAPCTVRFALSAPQTVCGTVQTALCSLYCRVATANFGPLQILGHIFHLFIRAALSASPEGVQLERGPEFAPPAGFLCWPPITSIVLTAKGGACGFPKLHLGPRRTVETVVGWPTGGKITQVFAKA